MNVCTGVDRLTAMGVFIGNEKYDKKNKKEKWELLFKKKPQKKLYTTGRF